MIVRIEAFFRKSWRWFSHNEWMARILNLPEVDSHPVKHGLVMVQIDGLGFTQFERAVKEGNMPFLKQLMRQEDYLNHRHYTGLPSNTPAVQGILFYGVKFCVPAFCFKDSQSGQVFNMFTPDSAVAVEKYLKEKGTALLEGGSSYGNIFTGGAKEAHFCVASAGWGGLLKALNPFKLSLTIALHLHIFIRAFFLIIVEFILAILDCLRGIIAGKNFKMEIGFIPMRVAVCILLREIIAAAAKIDIARGMPVIHLNLAGYDEQAHHRGPTSDFAHWHLRGIDSAIRRIWTAARRSQQRDYDIFVYSDHGQEETTPYPDVHGRTIQEAVNQVFKEEILSGKWQTQFSEGIPYWRAHLLRNPKLRVENKISPVEAKDEAAQLKVTVAAMGPVGHIYLPKLLSPEEKEIFAAKLVTEAKIPIVMAQNGPGKAWAWNEKGKFAFPEEADQVIETSHPFFKEVAGDLVEVCHHPDAGEFVIYGWKPGPKSLTFPREVGSHAGPGPEETSGFALLPLDTLPRSFGKIIHTQDLRDAAYRSLLRGDDKAFMGRDFTGEAPSSTLRVMTYNVHGCMGRDGKISPTRIARIIARHQPDVVCLQELDVSDHTHQAEIIAQKLAMTFQFHCCLAMKKGQHGNAIFSRFPMKPIRSGSLPKLSGNRFFEPRGAVWVEIDLWGQKVNIFNTHLSLSANEGFLQTEALLGSDWIGNAACQDPVILCGDLNALPKSKICGLIGRRFKNAQFELSGHRILKTLPSFHPIGLVDHVFVGAGIKTLSISVPKTKLERVSSDHLPLIVELEIKPQE